MSDLTRRRRADAERNSARVLEAAIRVLGERPDAATEDIAAAAGVTRQTVYAHYPSREALVQAVVDRITVEVAAALDAVDVDEGTAQEALHRWLEACWSLLGRYPFLLSPALPAGDYDSHAPVMGQLTRLLDRGVRTGEFDRRVPRTWLVAAVIGLGHAAGQEVTAGRMTAAAAGHAFRDSAIRVCLHSGQDARAQP